MSDSYLMPTYARQPVTFSKGEGCWLTDDTGKRYLDAVAGIAVCNLGHCHPAVTQTLIEQAQQLVHTSNLYHVATQEALASRLCQQAGMDKVFFGNSGAEANEAAIKLARLFGHRKGIDNPCIIVMERAFHGRTMATLTATGNRKAQAGFEPLVSGFVRAPYDDLDAVQRILANNKDVVGILAEPIQGEGGIHVPAAEYLPGLRQLCDDHDLLLMLDEIQTGNGRTGTLFAYQHSTVLPDVVTTAKGLGNGFPIGACMVRGKATDLFGPGSHGSTYGGNPLGCAVALTVLKTLTDSVVGTVTARGDYLRQALRETLAEVSLVTEIRGLGLMTGVELSADCGDLVETCREQGLLINVTAGNVIRLVPPLVISETEIDQLVRLLSGAIIEFANTREAT